MGFKTSHRLDAAMGEKNSELVAKPSPPMQDHNIANTVLGRHLSDERSNVNQRSIDEEKMSSEYNLASVEKNKLIGAKAKK